MADAFYAPANEAESNNFDEYYTQKYKDENWVDRARIWNYIGKKLKPKYKTYGK
jgi:hypothetical protein